jgi:hypothetical protein
VAGVPGIFLDHVDKHVADGDRAVVQRHLPAQAGLGEGKAELALLNEIYALPRLMISFFSPQRKLIEKRRERAKVLKRYGKAQTPCQRVLADPQAPKKIKTGLTQQYRTLNPAQLRRNIHALSQKLLKINKAKHEPCSLPAPPPAVTRARSDEATKDRSRAS